MIKYISPIALLATLSWAAISCSSEYPTIIGEDEFGLEDTGSARMALTVGDRTITSVTAVISRKHGKFESQTHTIDVTGDSGVVSIFFGSLPVARGYEVELKAADCSGSAKFDITSGVTTQVPITITCPGGSHASDETGSVRITGNIVGGGSSASCDIVSKIVAAPATQNGNGPLVKVSLFLEDGVSATNIVWTPSSQNGGSGAVGNLVGTQDQEITFDCTTNGQVSLVAAVTASKRGTPCTEQARVQVDCINQTGSSSCVCGNNIIECTEQCDGTQLPAGTPAGSSCSAQCTLITSGVCGNGIINPPEVCDGSALPPTAPVGSTCSQQCTLIVPIRCGDGIINQASEQCDGSAFPSPPPPVGTTCSNTCQLVPPLVTCGNLVINPPEECDGTTLPTTPPPPAGSVCDASCHLVRCGDGVVNQASEACDGTAFRVTPPAGTTCSSTCQLVTAAPRCGDGILNQASEECDGTVFRVPPAAGSICNPLFCVVVPPVATPFCGDGIVNQASEACDGTAFRVTPPAGTTCSAACALVPPVVGGSGACHHTCVEDDTTASCQPDFAAVGADSKALLDCVLGTDWPAPNKFPVTSCANGPLLSCYCGPLSAGACIPALPSTLTGQCKDLILSMTGCGALAPASQGSCVSGAFTNGNNAAGRAMNYVACLQNNCPDICTTPPPP